MYKAYDNFLQAEVTADLAAQNSSGDEPFRYECSFCGEEVFVAAKGSIRKSTHFRHRSGNNEVECEKYLGAHTAMRIDTFPNLNRGKNEKYEFYFDGRYRQFYLGLKYSADELDNYANSDAQITVRCDSLSSPITVCYINKINFSPNVLNLIPISNYSERYYIINSFQKTEKSYDIFGQNHCPCVFKVQNEVNHIFSRLIQSKRLFTNTKYVVIFNSAYSVLYSFSSYKGISIDDTIDFNTMNRFFKCFIITITEKTPDIESLLRSWGYELDSTEELTLLWPPSKTVYGEYETCSDTVYVQSSFLLQPNGNINKPLTEINSCGQGISSVRLGNRLRILKKNVDISVIQNHCKDTDISTTNIEEVFCRNFVIPDDNYKYFYYSSIGVTELNVGQKIILSPNTFIIKYESYYPIAKISYKEAPKLLGAELLIDILAHNKVFEIMRIEDFVEKDLSIIAQRYLDACIKTGMVNTVAKKYILEGLI